MAQALAKLPVLALLLATASAFRPPLPTRVRAAPRAALPDTLLLLAEATADTKATVTEAVGAEVYGPIFFGGIGLFLVGVGGAAVTALLIDKSDAYERLADDFMAEGKRELEAEFGVEATEAVLSGKTPARPAAAAPAAESAPDEDGYDD